MPIDPRALLVDSSCAENKWLSVRPGWQESCTHQ
jgi:hypothetical protein